MKSHLRTPAMVLLLATLATASHGCTFFEGDPKRWHPGIPIQVTGVRAEAGDKLVTVSWTPVTVATSYSVYFIPELIGTTVVTKENATRVNVTSSSTVIAGLDNNVRYDFMVTALDYEGEGPASDQVSAMPGPISDADLVGTWYFHTLVTGPDARWARGTATVDGTFVASVSEYEVSNGTGGSDHPTPPASFAVHVNGNGEVSQPGAGAWADFRGSMGSRKNMMVATHAVGTSSRALTLFQRRKADSDPDYTIADIMGTGSKQNPNNPALPGHGPTRFAYHQLSSGSSAEWEYVNGKVGQEGQIWRGHDSYKDVIYWQYGTPDYKLAAPYDFLWKVSSFGIDATGLVTEYDNFDPSTGRPRLPTDPPLVWFTGRMTADRSVVVGVGTRNSAWPTGVNGTTTEYFLRIMELCFRPNDQTVPTYTLADLAGSYRFQEIGAATVTAATARGSMVIDRSGNVSFPSYSDSTGATQSSGTFTLAYYPDEGLKEYADLATFATSTAQAGTARYLDSTGTPFHTYYDFWTNRGPGVPPNPLELSSVYYNEHGALSYNRDLFVLTRTGALGNSLIVGLK